MGAYEGASAGFVLSTAYFAVPEGDSNTFTVALTEDPGGEITVTIAKESGDSDITVSTSSLAFNSSNYSTPKSVTIEAADDSDYLNGNALISVIATGFFTSSVTAAEQDDDNVPSVLHVDYRAQGNNAGADWANAFTDLQDALDVASEYSDVKQIRISQGTYKPARPSGSSFESFVLVSGVIVKGGYGGLGAPSSNVRDFDAYETVLSGDLKGDDVGGMGDPSWGENSRRVLIGSDTDANTVLDGFTIKHGNAASRWHDFGGGMYNQNGYLTLINCRFIENFASQSGGGLNNYVSSPTLINCEFISNSATEQGGGVHGSSTLTNCKFTDNSAEYGGGISATDMTLNDCEFTDNSADYGGAVSIGDTSSATLNSCKFYGNQADYDGGAMWNWDAGMGMTITNCLFVANSTYGYGGAIYNAYSSPALKHCTFTENSSGGSGSGHAIASEGSDYGPVLTGCILWDGGYEIYDATDYGTIITYSDVQGDWPGGNIDADPCLVREPYDGGDGWGNGDNDDYGDLRLLPDSPCIDAGDPDYIAEPNETDLDGKPRVMGGRIDMGAYESPLPAEARIIPHTINLASKGNWITCYIWLPEEYDVADIEANTVLLDGQVKAESVLPDEKGQIAIARFSREEVQAILNIGQIELTITGQLADGTIFEATDVIRVIDKAGKN
jgi:predicted outer membrane repeat protein